MQQVEVRIYFHMGDSERSRRCKGLCDVCHVNTSKYTCPACATVTCSLECCKQHKICKCSGKRGNADFVPMLKFADRQLHRDFRFLSSVERCVDHSKRKSHSFSGDKQ